MTDLSRLIADLCASLGEPEKVSVSSFPETVSGAPDMQLIDNTDSFWGFQGFRSDSGSPAKGTEESAQKQDVSPGGSRVTSACSVEPERPETPESDRVLPLAEAAFLFPVEDSEPERPETGSGLRGSLFSTSDTPCPISPADVRAGVARELYFLHGAGREGPDALRDAVEITRAKIRNAPALAERQVHAGRCHVCGDPLDDSRAVVALIQVRGGHLWLHHGECCLEHGRRRMALVDEIMRAGGYGAGGATGEAA